MKFKNILCPVDYSEASQAALEKAAKLARQYESELHIVKVYELLFAASAETMAPIPVSPDLVALRRQLESVRPLGVKLKHELIHGIPGYSILSYADENDIDLIVMGSKSRRGAARWLLGSTTETIIRSATCPVLAVHSESDQQPRDSKIAETFNRLSETKFIYQ